MVKTIRPAMDARPGKKVEKSSVHCTPILYAEACNEWRGSSPRPSAWATQKRPSGGESSVTVSDLTGPGIEPQTAPTVMSSTAKPTGRYERKLRYWQMHVRIEMVESPGAHFPGGACFLPT